MSDSKNICLSCGLCCDGTLIGFVQLETEEIPAIKKLMPVEELKGNGFFIQPCKSYCNGCTIYSQRPKRCDSYNCGLLNSFNQNEVDFDSAVATVKIVKQMKQEIEKKLKHKEFKLKSKSFYFKIVELQTMLLKKNSKTLLNKNQTELLFLVKQLDELLTEKFDISLA